MLVYIQGDSDFKWAKQMKLDPNSSRKDWYCQFHWDHGYDSEDCFKLRKPVEKLIKEGKLQKFVTNQEPPPIHNRHARSLGRSLWLILGKKKIVRI